jgi:hypothetical protein
MTLLGFISKNQVQRSFSNDYVIPRGTVFKNAILHGSGGIAVEVVKRSKYDDGYRVLPKETYKIYEVVKNECPYYAPYLKTVRVDGFELFINAKVNVVTTKEIVEVNQNKQISYRAAR